MKTLKTLSAIKLMAVAAALFVMSSCVGGRPPHPPTPPHPAGAPVPPHP